VGLRRGTNSGFASVGTAALMVISLAYLGWMLRVFRARGFITRYL